MPSRGWRRLGRRRTSLLLEHLEHPVRDEESADDVRHGGEQGDRPQDADHPRVLGARDRDRPDHGNRRDRVLERHEGRIEQAGHATNHTQPDERRQDEHEQHGPVVDHDFRTSPAWVTQVSRMISSSKSRTSLPSRATCNRKLEMVRAYIWLACSGSVLGTLRGPSTSTPLWRTSVPGSVSSQFPPVSAARSTIRAPCFIPRTASAVITTAASFTCSAMNASSRRWVSSESCFA